MRTLYVLQHVEFEGPGNIEKWTAARGIALTVVRVAAGDPFPKLQKGDGLVVMGGPMGVGDTDDFPWLAAETSFLRDAIEARVHVLGICLGAQLLAHALGAKVGRNPEREIGWFPVELTPEGTQSLAFFDFASPFNAFHWHGDTYLLPLGAKCLARSAGCAQQAFQWGDRVLGLQFHLEATAATVEDMIAHGAGDLSPGRYVQTPVALRAGGESGPGAFAALESLLFTLLDGFFGDTR